MIRTPHPARRARAFPLLLALPLAALPRPADAQFGAIDRPRDLDAVEDEGRPLGRTEDTPPDRRPGTLDPYDHAAFVRLGFGRSEDASGTATFLPFTFGADVGAGDHVLVRGRFGMTGMKLDPAAGETERVFRPGNLELGAFYRFGTTSRRDGGKHLLRTTFHFGGTFVAPTAQENGEDVAVRALAVAGAYGVHGLDTPWSFTPEAGAVVPGLVARLGYGPLFVNLEGDLALGFSTDSDYPAPHAGRVRIEAGFRGGENFRLGAAFAHTGLFGDVAAGQSSVRAFFRWDAKALVLGSEFVVNLGAPYGGSFEDDGLWGLVSTVGLSL